MVRWEEAFETGGLPWNEGGHHAGKALHTAENERDTSSQGGTVQDFSCLQIVCGVNDQPGIPDELQGIALTELAVKGLNLNPFEFFGLVL